MANDNRPMGFHPINSPQGSVQKTAYRIEKGYTTALYVGDPVTLSGGYIVKATAGTAHSLLGFIDSFECDEGMDVAGYCPASSANTYKAIVADAVDQRFVGQDDGEGTPMDLLDIGKTGNLVFTHSGSTDTNLSGVEADGSSFSGSGQAVTDQLRLVGIVDRPDNVAGANAEWVFTIHNHYYRQENNVDAT